MAQQQTAVAVQNAARAIEMTDVAQADAVAAICRLQQFQCGGALWRIHLTNCHSGTSTYANSLKPPTAATPSRAARSTSKTDLFLPWCCRSGGNRRVAFHCVSAP